MNPSEFAARRFVLDGDRGMICPSYVRRVRHPILSKIVKALSILALRALQERASKTSP